MENDSSSQPSLLLIGLEETIGAGEMERLFEIKGFKSQAAKYPLGNTQSVHDKMADRYGHQGARGILVCSGRAAFRQLVRAKGKEIGFEQDSFRFAPGRVKLKKGILMLTRWMEQNFQQHYQVLDEENAWLVRVKSPETSAAQDSCDFLSGILQEFLAWAGGGKPYSVRESACQQRGDAFCCLEIGKIPLE